jgi:hypothetical protein
MNGRLASARPACAAEAASARQRPASNPLSRDHALLLETVAELLPDLRVKGRYRGDASWAAVEFIADLERAGFDVVRRGVAG